MANQPHRNKRVVSVPMSKDMKGEIERIARAAGKDVGSIIREAIQQHYEINTEDWKHDTEKTDG
jgi:predicted transcriptional regulator